MSKLRELEKEALDLHEIVDKALTSNNMEDREYAREAVENSELFRSEGNFRRYIDERYPIVQLIKLATKTLPAQIEALNKKLRLLEVQLDSESSISHDSAGTSASDFEDFSSSLESEYVLDLSTSNSLDEVGALSQEESFEDVASIPLVDLLNDALDPYIKTLEARTNEYSYGAIEYTGSFFGLSGYSKTEKLAAIESLQNVVEAIDRNEAIEPLDDRTIDVLTSGDLGNKYINPLKDDSDLAECLSAALSPKNDTTPGPEQ